MNRKGGSQHQHTTTLSSIGSVGGFVDGDLIKVPPYHFLHVLNLNTNVVRVVDGPCRYTRLDHEKIILGPEPMIAIPPRHYCIIDNPVIRAGGEVTFDTHKQAKLRHGEQEIRMAQEPFPLYPGEKINGNIQPLTVVAVNTALKLHAVCDFEDKEPVAHKVDVKEKGREAAEHDHRKHNARPVSRVAGDEWLLPGPCTYYPRIEVEVKDVVQGLVLKPDQALHLRALYDLVDGTGTKRKAGEEWLMRQTGTYLPGVHEKVVKTVDGHVLREGQVLHLRAKTSFVDIHGKERKAGEEWLVSNEEGEIHIPDVYEELVGIEKIISLTKKQYCVIQNPVEDGKIQLGKRALIKGPKNFYLQPGEVMEGFNATTVLMAEQALLVRATEQFQEVIETDPRDNRPIKTKLRKPGDKWLVYGPGEYVPPLEVEVLQRKTAFIRMEGANFYLFDLTPVLLVLFILVFIVYFLSRSSGSKPADAAVKEL
eukprot:TRINITY_DN4506_c0_g1_i2.p1 TRINITY_DN4506_c0_g1~~TRINITY_DN4506_c0_g1_i2.p1  ORF type:complete len:480 (-),score=83.75 TRINITY_DN4506_c0_g1_i2:55-1494(-)